MITLHTGVLLQALNRGVRCASILSSVTDGEIMELCALMYDWCMMPSLC